MTETAEFPDDIEIICDQAASTIAVDGWAGALVQKNAIKVNFFEDRLDPSDGKVKRHVVVRLAVPNDSFEEIVDSLVEFREHWRKNMDSKS
ncbi:MAG: hypothetical protein H7Z12_18255 [Rhodospirillaceae bacterium]|nr:hypothetical protein [Rhodospirillales bacterium]